MNTKLKQATVIALFAIGTMSTNAQLKIVDGNIQIGDITSTYKFNVAGVSKLDGDVGIGRSPVAGYKLSVGGSLYMNNANVNYVNQLHFGANVRFYDETYDNYLVFKYGDAAAGGIKFYDGNNIRQGYIYSDGNNTTPSFGLLDADGSWAIRIKKDTDTRFYVNGSQKMIIQSNGNVGIGCNPDPEFKLDIAGVVNAVNIATESDIRFKKDIKDYKTNTYDLFKLRPVSYTWKKSIKEEIVELADSMLADSLNITEMVATTKSKIDYKTNFEKKYNRERVETGFIAQEIRELYPDLVFESESGYLSVNYIGLIPMIIGALKEQQTEIEVHVKEIDVLKEENANQQNLINEQKKNLDTQQKQIDELYEMIKALKKE